MHTGSATNDRISGRIAGPRNPGRGAGHRRHCCLDQPAVFLDPGNFGVFGPYTVLVIGTAIALWFNRGRAFIALISLLVSFIAYRTSVTFGQDDFPVRAVLTATAIFVPANILLVMILPERGIVYFRNYRWLLLGAVEVL